VRIVLLGTRRLGYEGLQLLVSEGHDVLAAFTTEHEITEGRGAAAFAALCAEHRIPFHLTADLDARRDELAGWGIDLFVSLLWERIVSSRVLDTARLGGMNVHQSAFPLYRGDAPQNWAILRGDRTAGVTLHWMVPEADAGDIIDQRTYEIGPDDTIADLGDRARILALAMLRERLPEIAAGTAPRRPQSHADTVLSMPRVPGDGWIEWSAPGHAIHDLVLAVTHPYPGAFTIRGRTPIFVWRARLADPPVRSVAVPGTVIRRSASGGGAWVSTGDGVQVAGEAEGPAAGVLRAGDRIGADIPALLAMIRAR